MTASFPERHPIVRFTCPGVVLFVLLAASGVSAQDDSAAELLRKAEELHQKGLDDEARAVQAQDFLREADREQRATTNYTTAAKRGQANAGELYESYEERLRKLEKSITKTRKDLEEDRRKRDKGSAEVFSDTKRAGLEAEIGQSQAQIDALTSEKETSDGYKLEAEARVNMAEDLQKKAESRESAVRVKVDRDRAVVRESLGQAKEASSRAMGTAREELAQAQEEVARTAGLAEAAQKSMEQLATKNRELAGASGEVTHLQGEANRYAGYERAVIEAQDAFAAMGEALAEQHGKVGPADAIATTTRILGVVATAVDAVGSVRSALKGEVAEVLKDAAGNILDVPTSVSDVFKLGLDEIEREAREHFPDITLDEIRKMAPDGTITDANYRGLAPLAAAVHEYDRQILKFDNALKEAGLTGYTPEQVARMKLKTVEDLERASAEKARLEKEYGVLSADASKHSEALGAHSTATQRLKESEDLVARAEALDRDATIRHEAAAIAYGDLRPGELPGGADPKKAASRLTEILGDGNTDPLQRRLAEELIATSDRIDAQRRNLRSFERSLAMQEGLLAKETDPEKRATLERLIKASQDGILRAQGEIDRLEPHLQTLKDLLDSAGHGQGTGSPSTVPDEDTTNASERAVEVENLVQTQEELNDRLAELKKKEEQKEKERNPARLAKLEQDIAKLQQDISDSQQKTDAIAGRLGARLPAAEILDLRTRRDLAEAEIYKLKPEVEQALAKGDNKEAARLRQRQRRAIAEKMAFDKLLGSR